jgi:co-chaperonin GroES (HSP10)
MAEKKDYPIKPIGKMLLIEFEPVSEKLTTKAGLILDNPEKKSNRKYAARLRDVGSEVDMNRGFKVGDKVIVNEFDVMPIEVPDPDNPASEPLMFAMVQEKNVFGVFQW